MKLPTLQPSTVAILAAAGVAGFLLLRWGSAIGEGVKAAATGSVDVVGGLASGRNVITGSARTDAYEGAGILGTLGAATDTVLGGAPSRVGEWLGGKVYDMMN